MDFEFDLIFQEVKSTGEKLTNTARGANQVYKEFRGHAKDFYFKLSILAGSTLSLSVTYIGFLASKPGFSMNFAEFLYLGWFCLVASVLSAMYRNHFYFNFGHWQVLTESNKARLASEEAVLNAVTNYPQAFANLTTQKEVDDEIARLTNNVEVIKKSIPTTSKKEKRAEKLWVVTENTAHISFVLGLILIVLFAGLNLPVQVNFSILEFLGKILSKAS
ncbi:hypothetical protein HYU96_01085 [Candidatus Daviesbacteria bacterium]|nr:hypothetical protein [Candidatus Daviesbacteria bacterium]